MGLECLSAYGRGLPFCVCGDWGALINLRSFPVSCKRLVALMCPGAAWKRDECDRFHEIGEACHEHMPCRVLEDRSV